MPKYHALQTRVKLSVSDLIQSTTLRLETRKGVATTKNIQQANAVLSAGVTLHEEPLLNPNRRGSSMSFLDDSADMPFFLARAHVGTSTRHALAPSDSG